MTEVCSAWGRKKKTPQTGNTKQIDFRRKGRRKEENKTLNAVVNGKVDLGVEEHDFHDVKQKTVHHKYSYTSLLIGKVI